MANESFSPGPVVLFGSGETSPNGRKGFEYAFQQLPPQPQVALLETPAGFELNSPQVIGRVGDFIAHSLQNYQPQITVVPARKRGTDFSPDDPEIIAPLYGADMIFMGPGSPTYAVRQLADSLAWHALRARHRLGAAMVLASAAAIAVSAFSLPVYEIYKVGEDLHWKPGLDFFAPYGLHFVFVPHWNNNEGGKDLDTSRCFMGKSRFARLMELLPADLSVVGIDENTALGLDLQAGIGQVLGQGRVTILHTGHEPPGDPPPDRLQGTDLVHLAQERGGHVHQYLSGESFALEEWRDSAVTVAQAGLPHQVWQEALRVQAGLQEQAAQEAEAPEAVRAMAVEREEARSRKDWAHADRLRDQIAALGWEVRDSPDGPEIAKKDSRS